MKPSHFQLTHYFLTRYERKKVSFLTVSVSQYLSLEIQGKKKTKTNKQTKKTLNKQTNKNPKPNMPLYPR